MLVLCSRRPYATWVASTFAPSAAHRAGTVARGLPANRLPGGWAVGELATPISQKMSRKLHAVRQSNARVAYLGRASRGRNDGVCLTLSCDASLSVVSHRVHERIGVGRACCRSGARHCARGAHECFQPYTCLADRPSPPLQIDWNLSSCGRRLGPPNETVKLKLFRQET